MEVIAITIIEIQRMVVAITSTRMLKKHTNQNYDNRAAKINVRARVVAVAVPLQQ